MAKNSGGAQGRANTFKPIQYLSVKVGNNGSLGFPTLSETDFPTGYGCPKCGMGASGWPRCADPHCVMR